MLTKRDWLLGAAAAVVTPHHLWAQTAPGLSLTLALDESASMVMGKSHFAGGIVQHDAIQARGHFEALRDETIAAELVRRGVHLHIIGWSDASQPTTLVYHDTILSAAAVAAAANAAANHRASPTGGTHHKVPIAYARTLPRGGREHILDIVTDEPIQESERGAVITERTAFEMNGGTVNVLAIGGHSDPTDSLRTVLCSPHGIFLWAKSWADFPAMIKLKLQLELGLA